MTKQQRRIVAIALGMILGLGARAFALTPGQTITVNDGTSWTNATYLAQDGGKYHVRYSDGTDEWVTPDRLRPDPTAPATGTGSGAAPSGRPADQAAAGPVAAPTPDPQDIPAYLHVRRLPTFAGPFMRIQLRKIQGVNKHATMPIAAKPQTRPASDFVNLLPAAGTELRDCEQLLVSPDAPNIVVAVGGRRGDDTPLLVLNTDNPAASESRVFTAKEHRVVAIADGGNILLSKPDAGDAPSLHLWVYKDQQYQLRINCTFIENQENARPESAMMVSATRMLMRSAGNNYLIDLPTASQLACIDCGEITMHASGRFLMTTRDQEGIMLRPSDLAMVGSLPAKAPRNFTVDPTGTLAAFEQDSAVVVAKLSNGADVARVEGATVFGKLNIVGTNDILIDGSAYYQSATGIPVWKYECGQTHYLQLANGQMLYVGNVNNQLVACAVTLPDTDALEGLSHTAGRFSIKPGAHIAIAGDLAPFGDVAKAQSNLENLIAAAGDQYDPDSACKLTVKATPGPTGTFTARVYLRPGPPELKDYPAPCTIVELTLTIGDTVIWLDRREHKFQGGWTHPGQTIEDAVAEAGRINADTLGYIHLPGYIVKGPLGKLVTLGASNLTRTGFKFEPPPKMTPPKIMPPERAAGPRV
jgi:hypothetical protein